MPKKDDKDQTDDAPETGSDGMELSRWITEHVRRRGGAGREASWLLENVYDPDTGAPLFKGYSVPHALLTKPRKAGIDARTKRALIAAFSVEDAAVYIAEQMSLGFAPPKGSLRAAQLPTYVDDLDPAFWDGLMALAHIQARSQGLIH